jgi:hypothetical protein
LPPAWEADHKVREEQADTGRKYAYRVKVNHAIGVLKDRLIGILITDDGLTRKWLYRELIAEMKRRIVPIRPNRDAARKEYLRKPHFHHNHQSNC